MACADCPYVHLIEELKEQSGRNLAAHEKIYGRLEEIEKNDSVTQYQYSQIMESIKEIKEDVSEIKSKPEKTLTAAKTALISCSVSAIIGVLITMLNKMMGA